MLLLTPPRPYFVPCRIDEYSWQSVNTDALPSVYQTNLFSKKQSMHFPHRSASHPDSYRLVLPFEQSLNLGLGQLTQSQVRKVFAFVVHWGGDIESDIFSVI